MATGGITMDMGRGIIWMKSKMAEESNFKEICSCGSRKSILFHFFYTFLNISYEAIIFQSIIFNLTKIKLLFL